MSVMQCPLCSYEYDDSLEDVPWNDLPEGWICPVCGSPKSIFVEVGGKQEAEKPDVPDSSGKTESAPAVYECKLCSNLYEEDREGISWNDLSDDWVCPVCGATKDLYLQVLPAGDTSVIIENPSAAGSNSTAADSGIPADYLYEWKRSADDFETRMADIHRMAETGESIYEPMRTRLPVFSWDEILIKGAQLSRLPLNKSQPVSTRTVIGPGAVVPMELDTPLIVSHMSFGALSREAKLALAKGSADVKGALCSGEGGILPECLDASHKYIFEYVPNKYSFTDEYLRQVDAVEIKIGQSAKPGMGGHLPAHKVTREIAEIRGFREGVDIISPSRFPDIRTREDLKETVDMLREKTGGKPVGVKLAAGHLEEDIAIVLYAGADFITIDGRAGGTGAALKMVKNAATIPTIFALHRARKILDESGADDVSLIITGGFRVSSDFIKALAMGADAVALATASMMALGCQQYRICDTGRCPVGIATQDPALRARLNVDASAQRVSNYFRVSNDELREFSRLSGHDDVHGLSRSDLCTVSSELSRNAGIDHA